MRRDIARVYTEKVDYLPGLSVEQKRAKLAKIHQRRVRVQAKPVRRLTAAELAERGAEHPPVPCLQMSCCGRISFPFLDEDAS